MPIIRYAEVLLMYAEAKAELGILTQDDVNQTINLIRQRAGMPDASLDDWLANIDPVQDERYPMYSQHRKVLFWKCAVNGESSWHAKGSDMAI